MKLDIRLMLYKTSVSLSLYFSLRFNFLWVIEMLFALLSYCSNWLRPWSPVNLDLPEQCRNWGHGVLGDLSVELDCGLWLDSVQSRKDRVDGINDREHYSSLLQLCSLPCDFAVLAKRWSLFPLPLTYICFGQLNTAEVTVCKCYI